MEILQGKLSARAVAEPVRLACPPGALLGGLDRRSEPVLLDSSALHRSYGRYTLAACEPLEVLTLRDDRLSDRAGRTLARGRRAFWPALRSAVECVRLTAPAPQTGYVPGWIGYLAYELGRYVERLPGRAPRDTALGDLRLAFYDAVLVYDALLRQWWLVQLVFDSPPPGAGRAAAALRGVVEEARARGESAWASAEEAPAPAPADRADAAARPLAGYEPNFTPDAYRRAVARCVEYITAGDIFQVNLSQRLTLRGVDRPLEVYRALRRRNPAWYAAYFRFEADARPHWLLCSSPELFLRVRGGRVITRPIKGTRPRVGNEAADRAAARALRTSPKDNAELAMIIDLLRNDLGRVCRYGTVRVTDRRALETHPTVYHLVGTVEGRLFEGVGPAELLRATFPGGSITGAPKIRAMEIIDEIEPVARGPYTGCIGIIGADGSCEWNIVIRTMVCADDRAFVQVGGGIVADSSPEGEYRETLAKARALLEAAAEAQAARAQAGRRR